MVKKLTYIPKLIGLILLLILAHITITYTVEQLELVSISPLTFPDYQENHITNILTPFPYLIVRVGWLYLLAFFSFRFLLKKVQKRNGLWAEMGIGIAIAMIFFFFWWAIVELFDPEILREGLIVYPITGIALALLHRLFFSGN